MPESWKNKLQYILAYYKLPICVGLGLLLVTVCFLHAKINEKECAFNAILFDIHTDVSEEVLSEEFAGYAGIDTETEDVRLFTTLMLADGMTNYAMASRSKFYALVGTGDLDAVIMCEDNFKEYIKADAFLDLSTVYTEKELASFPELYKDQTGRVLGVYANELPVIRAIEGYKDSIGVMGILYNTRHVDTAKQFFGYLMNR